jgi:hypothetical protein
MVPRESQRNEHQADRWQQLSDLRHYPTDADHHDRRAEAI